MTLLHSVIGSRILGWGFLAALTLSGGIVGGAHTGQPALEAEATRFAAAWEAGDVKTLGRAMRSEGIRLHLQGEEHLSIKPKQAQAALGSFMDRYPAGESEVTKVSLVGGDAALGFAEIGVHSRTAGLPNPVIFSLFVGFALEGDTWKVTEIRVFN